MFDLAYKVLTSELSYPDIRKDQARKTFGRRTMKKPNLF